MASRVSISLFASLSMSLTIGVAGFNGVMERVRSVVPIAAFKEVLLDVKA